MSNESQRKGGFVRHHGQKKGRVKHAVSRFKRLLTGDSNQ